MKKSLILFICVIISFSAFAQKTKKESNKVIADTAIVQIPTKNGKKEVKVIFEMGEESIDDNLKVDTSLKTEETEKKVRNPNLFAGITFSRFDLGLAKMIDNGSGTLSDENDFLSYKPWKSVNVGFDVLQIGYKFTNQFRVTLAAGFDWTHFRLKNDVIIEKNKTPLSFIDSDINYTKNRFSSSYLRIPLTFEVRSKGGTFNRRLRLAAGPIAGLLIQGSQKFKSKEEGKNKTKDDFNYTPFRYGAFTRVGYGAFGLYGKYYFNDIFENSPDLKDLQNVSFGMMLFF